MQKLHDEPEIEHQNMSRAYDGLRESSFNCSHFVAWKEGKTGEDGVTIIVDDIPRLLPFFIFLSSFVFLFSAFFISNSFSLSLFSFFLFCLFYFIFSICIWFVWTSELRLSTGYPMVDACMRALHTSGWINFRMRAMLVSFAVSDRLYRLFSFFLFLSLSYF